MDSNNSADMATFEDLALDWSMLCQDCTECWTTSDLQLAAELGKTLLERNKELENSLKQHQNIIEDQTQEIEYLTKQTVALREVNDSRLRIYEQLEVSIQDLERANHRLALENSADKKQIKNLCLTIDSLEIKCDELQKNLDDVNRQLELQKRRAQRELAETKEIIINSRLRSDEYNERGPEKKHGSEPLSQEKKIQCDTSMLSEHSFSCIHDSTHIDNLNQIDEMAQLLEEIRELRANYTREQRRVAELEEQMQSLVKDNRKLEQKLVSLSQDDEMKSMHDELTTLEEVRQGQLCGRCLRSIEGRARDELLMMLDQEEEDDDEDCIRSINDSLINETEYHTSISLEIQDTNKQDEHHSIPTQIESHSNNPYRVLVEKYEALLEVKRNPVSRSQSLKPAHCMSLQEELQMSGDFNSFSTKDTDEESGHGGDNIKRNSNNKSISVKKERKAFSRTPTDFSEAETSSSGFSDETSNKATQTEGIRPGSFVCTVADGENSKLSIYNDDTGHRDGRFHNVPQYLEVFDEIYAVLKKAAEDVDNGEKLPLMDDHVRETIIEQPSIVDDLASNFTDDSQSVMSSAMSELSTTLVENNENITISEKPEKEVIVPEPFKETVVKKEILTQKKPERVLTPYKREPLEYLSVAVGVRKKSTRKGSIRKQTMDRSESPILPLSPRVSYTSRLGNGSNVTRTKKRDYKPNEIPTRATDNEHAWNGNSLLIFSSNRNVASPTPSQSSTVEFKPSTASHDLHKLKKLELSYAEVLRNADAKKYSKSSHRRK